MKQLAKKAWSAALLVMVLLGNAQEAVSQQQPNPLRVSFTNVTASHDVARAKQVNAQAVPGDTLRYVLTFTNPQARAVQNIVFDNPIPRGISLIGGTVTTSVPAKVEYSIDNGTTYSARPMVSVLENGRTVERPAPAESYTHIRWTIPGSLAPSAVVTARYDTRVGGR